MAVALILLGLLVVGIAFLLVPAPAANGIAVLGGACIGCGLIVLLADRGVL